MSKLEEFNLNYYKKTLGLMSSTEALEEALTVDAICRKLGPFDISYQRFANMRDILEEYALLLERNGE